MKISERFMPDGAMNTIEQIKVNGVVQVGKNKVIDLTVPDDTLTLASENTTDTNVLISHDGGMNDVDSIVDITITLKTFADIAIPVGSIFVYNQANIGKILMAKDVGVTCDLKQTYKKGDVLTLWHKTLNNWVVLNPPMDNVVSGGLTSSIIGEITGARAITNIVKISQENYDLGTPKDETVYIIEPDPIVVPEPINLIKNSTFEDSQFLTFLPGGGSAPRWEIVSGKLRYIGGSGAFVQFELNNPMTSGTYQISFEVSDVQSGEVAKFQLFAGTSTGTSINSSFQSASLGLNTRTYTHDGPEVSILTIGAIDYSGAGAFKIDNMELIKTN